MGNESDCLEVFAGTPSLHTSALAGAMSVTASTNSRPALPIPPEALAFKLRFLREKRDIADDRKVRSEDRSRLPLERVSELYFAWKAANSSPGTIAREKRLFKRVERYVGSKTPLRLIDLELLREYQRDRRKEISPTMKKPVSARSVNYELWLLRGVMKYANCWKGDLAENYQPLSQKRSQVGKVATKDQLAKIIGAATLPGTQVTRSNT